MKFERSTKGETIQFKLKYSLSEMAGTIIVLALIAAFGGIFTVFFYNLPDNRNAAYISASITILAIGLLYFTNIRGQPNLEYNPTSKEVKIGDTIHTVDPEDKIILNREIEVQKSHTHAYEQYLNDGGVRQHKRHRFRTNGRVISKYKYINFTTWQFDYQTKEGKNLHLGSVTTDTAENFNKFTETIAKELRINFIDKSGEQAIEIDHQDLDLPLVEQLGDVEPLHPDTNVENELFDINRHGAGTRINFVIDPLSKGDLTRSLFFSFIFLIGIGMTALGYLIYSNMTEVWFAIFPFIMFAFPGIFIIYFSIRAINRLKWIDYIIIESDEIGIGRDHLITHDLTTIPIRELERIVLIDLKDGNYAIEFISDELRYTVDDVYQEEPAKGLIHYIKRALANYS